MLAGKNKWLWFCTRLCGGGSRDGRDEVFKDGCWLLLQAQQNSHLGLMGFKQQCEHNAFKKD